MKTYLMVPTYNERENILDYAKAVLKCLPKARILFVDDSSPDGTAEAIQRLKKQGFRVELLLRPLELKGRGWAGRDGFVECLRRGADVVVEMDADLSHDPGLLRSLLKPIKDGEADVVLGSRFIPGGQDEDRAWYRAWISRFARTYLNAVLGLRVADPTTGYRAYSRKALEAIQPASLRARDPFCVTEILYRCRQRSLRISEIPIHFKDRQKGHSKLRGGTLLAYLGRVLLLRLTGKA